MAESQALDSTSGAGHYRRHRPELTLLYQVVEQHYPEFEALMRAQGRELPAFVQREFTEYLKCGRFEHGFLRVRCGECKAEKLVAFSWPLLRIPAHAALVNPFTSPLRGFCPSCGARRMVDTAALLVDEVLPHKPVRQWVLSVPFALRFLFAREPQVMGSVLGIVVRAISSHLIASAGFTRARAGAGAVTLIQRFGGALNLNIHYHMLFLDGVYVTRSSGGHRFLQVEAPTSADLTRLVVQISERVGRHLERRGLLVRDSENAYLEWDGEEASPLDDLAGHAITYRIAVGPNRGQKAFTLQTLPASELEAGSTTPVASAIAPALLSALASCFALPRPSLDSYLLHPCSRAPPGFRCTRAWRLKRISGTR
jgi:hypothetical protein